MVTISSHLDANTWIRIDGDYYYCWGRDHLGNPRLAKLNRRPYGKHVHIYDPKTTLLLPTTEKVPLRLHPSTLTFLTLAALTLLIFAPDAFSGRLPLPKVVVAVTTAVLLFIAYATHAWPLHPRDAIQHQLAEQAIAESIQQSQIIAEQRAAQQRQQALARNTQLGRAHWAQQARLNAQNDPDGDHWRTYGQSPW